MHLKSGIIKSTKIDIKQIIVTSQYWQISFYQKGHGAQKKGHGIMKKEHGVMKKGHGATPFYFFF
jgi:hypothetical protein